MTKISLTCATVEKMSRYELLEWVNSTLHGHYGKIEELCSGVAYCQLMELLFPNSVNSKKIKSNAKMEHEFLHNLKLVQAALIKLNFDKPVPMERLIKGKFQDNFEFLQWFKKFFDTHSDGKGILKVPAALAAAAQNAPKPVRKPGTQPVASGATIPKTSSGKTESLKTPKGSQQQKQESIVSPSSLRVMQDTREQLTEQVLNLEMERNAYYRKLSEIEAVLKESVNNEVDVDWCNRVLTILYAVDDNAAAGDEGA